MAVLSNILGTILLSLLVRMIILSNIYIYKNWDYHIWIFALIMVNQPIITIIAPILDYYNQYGVLPYLDFCFEYTIQYYSNMVLDGHKNMAFSMF